MAVKSAVLTNKAPKPLPVFSQAIVHDGMIYCSGSIGVDPASNELVSGGIAERTDQSLKNLAAVLEAGGSSLKNVVKVNIFITNMDNFAEMNKVYQMVFNDDPKPCRTCVAVKQLPLDTDVEIECIAYLYGYALVLKYQRTTMLTTGAIKGIRQRLSYRAERH